MVLTVNVSETSAHGALSVIAGAMSCQSAILRGLTHTMHAGVHAHTGMHIITQAGVDSRHFLLTSPLSFSGRLQKAGSARCLACSHLERKSDRHL